MKETFKKAYQFFDDYGWIILIIACVLIIANINKILK